MLRIAGIQQNLIWQDAQANRVAFTESITKAAENAQVVILPEMFSTGFSMQALSLAEKMDGPTMQWLLSLAVTLRIIIGGSLIIEEDGKFYNRFVWVQPNGEVHCYNKRHLFSYAKEQLHYTAGDTRTIVSVNGVRIALFVCYDLRFPAWCRQQHNALYDVAIFVANWPQVRIEAWQALLKARAIENQAYVIGINRVGTDGSDLHYNGASTIIDYSGKILEEAFDINSILNCTIDKEGLLAYREKFRFLDDADSFSITN
jgi:omega-amidase